MFHRKEKDDSVSSFCGLWVCGRRGFERLGFDFTVIKVRSVVSVVRRAHLCCFAPGRSRSLSTRRHRNNGRWRVSRHCSTPREILRQLLLESPDLHETKVRSHQPTKNVLFSCAYACPKVSWVAWYFIRSQVCDGFSFLHHACEVLNPALIDGGSAMVWKSLNIQSAPQLRSAVVSGNALHWTL